MLNFPSENCVEKRRDGAAYRLKICGHELSVIACSGGGWDHVSVSSKKRCPSWHEMCRIKEMFFGDNVTAIQYHPLKSDYINEHPRCLHLWRKQGTEIELPPIEYV